MIKELLIQDVRCFQGEHRARLSPITLLVGENSTGKTTFLGCYSVLHRLISRSALASAPIDFNMEPFSMGSFREIVRSTRGRAGRIDHFKLGFTITPMPGSRVRSYPILVTFSERGSQPVVTSIHIQFKEGVYLNIRRNSSGDTTLETPERKATLDYSVDNWMYLLDYLFRPDEHLGESEDVRGITESLTRLLSGTKSPAGWRLWLPDIPQVAPLAPLRSKPKRTYDPVREAASPSGEHVPMLMMRLDRTEKDDWSSLRDGLVEFGGYSGLFSDIKIRGHGRQMSDPFQVQVKVRSGTFANIMDVGYGVSQSLPILVDVRRAKRHTFLLQQPEVHLHPRAQAGLAVLFAQAWKQNRNRFLIETHSDHIVDRIRILVRNGDLTTDDVAILYFESNRNSVVIHNIGIDADGNLQNVPAGYRQFFLEETDQLLGFA
ncbi:MAG: AAA family ATPase [Gammaproteobacteria bacterium]|nr:AAA family ATPase [Gammaproteobacteria bacterium]